CSVVSHRPGGGAGGAELGSGLIPPAPPGGVAGVAFFLPGAGGFPGAARAAKQEKSAPADLWGSIVIIGCADDDVAVPVSIDVASSRDRPSEPWNVGQVAPGVPCGIPRLDAAGGAHPDERSAFGGWLAWEVRLADDDVTETIPVQVARSSHRPAEECILLITDSVPGGVGSGAVRPTVESRGAAIPGVGRSFRSVIAEIMGSPHDDISEAI